MNSDPTTRKSKSDDWDTTRPSNKQSGSRAVGRLSTLRLRSRLKDANSVWG